MNSRRFLSLLLLLFVLCFVLFSASFTAYAATEDVASTIDKISWEVRALNKSNGSVAQRFYGNTINAGEWGTPTQVSITNYRWSNYFTEFLFTYYKSNGTTLIAKKGTDVTFNISNFVLAPGYTYSGENYGMGNININSASSFTADFKDLNGNIICTVPIQLKNITSHGVGMISFSVDSETLTDDCYKIDIRLKFETALSFYKGISSTHWNDASNFYLLTGFGSSSMIETLVDDTTGLLTSIKIYAGRISTGIINLPKNIWAKFETGLKGLFVPTASQMTDVKGQWDSLLSDRFGGLYQTVQLIDDYAATFKEPSASKSSIDFPEFRLNVGNNEEFVLQAHDVQIVPDRFSFLVDVVKTIISIIATCLFINGLRNKFERLVGGQE